jgi:PAS domain S-box-containing protein
MIGTVGNVGRMASNSPMDHRAVVVADRSGVIQMWSRGAERLFGHPADQAVGQTLDLIVPEAFRDMHWTGFRHAMEQGAAKLEGQSSEIPVRFRDGTVTPCPGRFVLLRDAGAQVIGAMAVFSPPN